MLLESAQSYSVLLVQVQHLWRKTSDRLRRQEKVKIKNTEKTEDKIEVNTFILPKTTRNSKRKNTEEKKVREKK